MLKQIQEKIFFQIIPRVLTVSEGEISHESDYMPPVALSRELDLLKTKKAFSRCMS